jgi:uncharacterized protein YbaP (TraB family)
MTTYAKRLLMKRIASLFFLVFLAVSQLFAQAPKSSLLWEISGNSLQKPSYIFGTMHLMCKEDFAISEILLNKFKSTQQLYCEVKIDEPGLQQQFALKMTLKDKTMQSFFTDADYKQVSDSFQKITGIPFAMFNKFKPFMTMGILTLKILPCTNKIQPETEFIQLAKANKLPLYGLETIDDEIMAIDKQPLDSQVNGLKQMLLHFDSIKTGMEKMIATYKRRNIDSLYSFITESSQKEGNNFEKDIVITRNKNWMPVIAAAIKQKATFFAVGAGHMGGNEGILNLLRTQGYKVTPVKF